MFLRTVGVALLACILALPGSIQAAHGGRGGVGHAGFNNGGIGHAGFYHNGFYGHRFDGYRGYSYYPRYYGYGWGGYYPYWSTPYYSAPAFTGIYSVPAYTGIEVTPPSAPITPTEPSNIGPVDYTSANAAFVEVQVPANAELWVEGDKTQQTGEDRMFTSPPLQTGRKYTYDVKARWIDKGKPVEVERQVAVEAGQKTVVDMRKP